MRVFGSLSVIFIFFHYFSNAKGQQCPPNEELIECPAVCDYDNCPKTRSPERTCFPQKPCPEPKCKCVFNYRRIENGDCIPSDECPPILCGPYEEFDGCPPYCPSEDCNSVDQSRDCPIFNNYFCIPSCRCVEGYWRVNGDCVPYKECKDYINKRDRLTACCSD